MLLLYPEMLSKMVSPLTKWTFSDKIRNWMMTYDSLAESS